MTVKSYQVSPINQNKDLATAFLVEFLPWVLKLLCIQQQKKKLFLAVKYRNQDRYSAAVLDVVEPDFDDY